MQGTHTSNIIISSISNKLIIIKIKITIKSPYQLASAINMTHINEYMLEINVGRNSSAIL